MGLESYWLIGLSAGLGVLALLQALTILPRPHWAYHRRSLTHEHEYAHNPGDGYFYCSHDGCDARKRLR